MIYELKNPIEIDENITCREIDVKFTGEKGYLAISRLKDIVSNIIVDFQEKVKGARTEDTKEDTKEEGTTPQDILNVLKISGNFTRLNRAVLENVFDFCKLNGKPVGKKLKEGLFGDGETGEEAEAEKFIDWVITSFLLGRLTQQQ